MKTRHLTGILLLMLFALILTGCSEYEKSAPGGDDFHRLNTIRFYFLDAEGRNMVNPDNLATYPVLCDSDNEKPGIPELIEDSNYYGPYSQQVRIDEEGEPYVSIIFPGNESSNKRRCYIYWGERFDRIDITYGYTNDGVYGGDGWYASVLAMKINGLKVYSDEWSDQYGSSYKIYLQRKGDQTQIRIE